MAEAKFGFIVGTSTSPFAAASRDDNRSPNPVVYVRSQYLGLATG